MEEGPSASECPVCFVQLSSERVPMSMPCGHTLCKCCIDQLGGESKGGPPDRKSSFPCPLCRQWVSIDSVTVNVTLRDLLEELRRPQPRPGGGVGSALNIPYGDVTFTELLDRGAFGEVHRAYWQGYEVAVKVFSSGKLSAESLQSFQREVLVMNSLRHPNVVILMGACQTPPRLCIVMEFVSGGSLHSLIHIDRVVMALSDIQQVSLCTCRGLQYLHSINIMHRDLKSKNVLLTGPLPCQAKLCDFGLARLRQENATMTGNVGTVHWTAPEIMVNKRYQFPADVYSFGMVLYEMAVGRIPFHNMIPMAVMMAVAIQKQRPPMPPGGVDQKLADLIDRCTRWEPEERPCVGAVLQSLLDLLPLVERTRGHTSSTQLELNHTNSLGYVFVLASQVGTSYPGQDSKAADTMDGLKKDFKEVTSPSPDHTPPTYETHPPPDTTDLQLALKLQKEEEVARRLQLESDEQLAQQLQNKENTFLAPMDDIPSKVGPPPQLLRTIKSGTHVLRHIQSPKTPSDSFEYQGKMETAMPSPPPPPTPPPPPPVHGRGTISPTITQRMMASLRIKVSQLKKRLKPVTTVEKRAFKVGRVVDDEEDSLTTMQYEIAHFDKSWLHQVEFKEPISPFPLGKVHNEKGYPLKGIVQSLSKLWKGDPNKKASPPAQRKKCHGDESSGGSEELRAKSGSGSKKKTSMPNPSKPSMEKRSLSGGAIRSNQISAASQGKRSVSYPSSLKSAEEEYDSSSESDMKAERLIVKKGASRGPFQEELQQQKATLPEPAAERDTMDDTMEVLRFDSRSVTSEVMEGDGEEEMSADDQDHESVHPHMTEAVSPSTESSDVDEKPYKSLRHEHLPTTTVEAPRNNQRSSEASTGEEEEAPPVTAPPMVISKVATPQSSDEGPVGVEGTELGPVGVEGTELGPVGVEVTELGPVGVEGTELGPVGVEGTELGPVGVEGTELGPVGVEGTELEPVGVEGTELGPVGVEGTEVGVEGTELGVEGVKESFSKMPSAGRSKFQSKKFVTKKLAKPAPPSPRKAVSVDESKSFGGKSAMHKSKQASKKPTTKKVLKSSMEDEASHNIAYFHPTKMAASEAEQHNPLYKSLGDAPLNNDSLNNDKHQTTTTTTTVAAPKKITKAFRKAQ